MGPNLPTAEDVRRVLALACLDVDEAELDALVRDLRRIAEHAGDLAELDAEPASDGALGGNAGDRADEPGGSLPVELALAEAPRAVGGGFAVPAFVPAGDS